MTSDPLVGGTGVKSERSESPATPKALFTAATETKPSNSGEAENPTTDQARAGSYPDERKMIMEQVQVIAALMTTAEVAKVLQVNRSTLSRWRAAGTGPRVVWLSPTNRGTGARTWPIG